MKKLFCCIVAVSILAVAQLSGACVGRTLHIGVSNTANERLLGEMISILITERTGTSVKVQVYRDSRELYGAVRKGEVNLLVETPDRALEVLGKQKEANGGNSRDLIKSGYRSTFNLAWLEPFGGSPQYAPVLTVETLSNYPALPKLLAKLSGALNNDAYARLLKSSDAGGKSRKAVRDFLKAKKLI
ncbi:putative lipoprotein [Geobacter metallireducens RCH3]|uniref:Lipoprotein, putative n=1 Tax=Geobacter metallireducens (strain ATCC 53774 / DSM 7210 / GS-15) TaxID=269799 RepID=Q39Y70_GEOMG|nr:hypothetical protein [Geobacter metallireducens]ABB30804.1 lipoprotein, putative [Geobacter metallireducens GS-15]EHP88216.1 putative lipoprotein [Geobacter metallireducens RCH3]